MNIRRAVACVVALGMGVTVPYLVAGPNFHADDWVFVRNGHFDGVLHAAGARQVGRLGATVVYDATFGAIGAHPLAIQFVQMLLLAGAAVSVLFALRCYFGALALAPTVLWLWVPNHSTLEYWASTTQVLVAIIALALGVVLLTRAVDERTGGWPACLLLAASAACYEITAAGAVIALVVLPLVRGGRVRWDIVVRGTLLVAAPVGWLLTHRSVYVAPTKNLDPTLVLPGNLALGVAPFSAVGRVLTGVAFAGALLACARLARPNLRRLSIEAEQLAAAGLVVIVAGVLPLATFATNFLGMDDRLTAVSGVGGAMVWVGVAQMVRRELPAASWRLVSAAAVVALIAVVGAIRVDRTRDVADAGDAAVAESHRFAGLATTTRVVQVPGPVAVAGRVDGLNDGWNATAATQFHSGRADIVVLVEIEGDLTGPPPGDPDAQFR